MSKARLAITRPGGKRLTNLDTSRTSVANSTRLSVIFAYFTIRLIFKSIPIRSIKRNQAGKITEIVFCPEYFVSLAENEPDTLLQL